ncbi:MAG TPA: diguanylate cyclase [Burkholderiaceae bacterium]|nr:diguanylate cyclase [Burkholderiaceae bacterium]
MDHPVPPAPSGPATQPAPLDDAPRTPAQLAKAALLRLAQQRLEPTPDNYARAYLAEAGEPASASDAAPGATAAIRVLERLLERRDAAPALRDAVRQRRWEQAERLAVEWQPADEMSAEAWASLIGRVARGLERGGRQWTSARKKDSLQRVLAAGRGDAARLAQRLSQLLSSWDSDRLDDPAYVGGDEAAEGGGASPAVLGAGTPSTGPGATARPAPPQSMALSGAGETVLPPPWQAVVHELAGAAGPALPDDDPRCGRLKARLADLVPPLAQSADEELAEDWRGWAADARRLLEHRQHLTQQLRALCQELTAGLSDLSEEGSWVQGQCELMRSRLEEGLTARTVRSVNHLLHATRTQQRELKEQRQRARDALKQVINTMLEEIQTLSADTGRFHDNVGRYADVIEQADSLESLAGVVKELVEEARAVQAQVGQAQQRLVHEQAQARELDERVRELEAELQRLSTEVATDPLTQIANRRGLMQAFEAEQARAERGGRELSVGLLDIDNFKKLNDTLGHQTGDEALRFLAHHVKQALRPMDTVARYGGEEFVVLLPETTVEEAQMVLTRLQRTLTAQFFMHEDRQVFITFSAGVTLYRAGERLEEALERADEALYEAKRTGKNRTCIA